MYIRTLDGREEYMLDVISCERERSINNSFTLDFTIVRTTENAHMFDLVETESTVCLDDDEYIIKDIESQAIGDSVIKRCNAVHRFYCELLDNFVYDKLNGSSVSISMAVFHALNGTGWEVYSTGTFGDVSFSDFGDDNSSKLFADVLNRFKAEFTINSSINRITLRNRVGTDIDTVFRWKSNIQTIRETIDTSELSTYIKAFGKPDDKGNPLVTAEYTSPNASIYGIRHAPVIRDERYTNQAQLLAYAKSKLSDQPLFEIEIEAAYIGNDNFELGDTLLVIHESMGIDTTARVLGIKDYPLEPKRIPVITLGNYNRKSYVQATWDSSKDWKDELLNNGKVKFDLLEAAVKIATEALNNSMTELEYPDSGGIIARSKTNSNHIVRFNSAGVGISVDGGLTYRTAMTAMGLVADVLTAGTINANFVRILGGTTSNQVTIENGKVSVLTPNGRGARLGDGYAWFAHEDGYGLYVDESGISSTRTPDILNSSGYVRTHNDTYNRGEDGLHFGSASHISNLVQNGPVIFTPKKAVNWNSLVIDKYSDTGEPYIAGGTHNNYNMKLVFASNELKVYDKVGGWGNIKAATFTPASSVFSKKNIEPYNTNALQEIVDTDIVKYHLKSDLDTEEKRVGVIMQEAPSDIVDIKGDGVDLYAMVSMSWKAIQQLKEENKALKQRIEVLENGSH